jgi:mannose-1-phosphate guanylyltransferase
MSVPTTALIVAGGRGTRLMPLTAEVPKPMLPFCGAPFLAGLARRLGDAGVQRIGLVVGADTGPFEPLIAMLAPHGLDVFLVPEPTPLDTAGGVRAAIADLDEAVLVLNGDVLCDLDVAALVARHEEAGAAATISLTRVGDTSTFGVCVLDGDRITAFVEKPAPGSLPGHDTVNAGAYVLAAGVLAGFAAGPLSFEREVFPTLLGSGAVLAGAVHEGVWTDLGTPERFLAGQRMVLDGALRWPPLDDLTEAVGMPGVRLGRDVYLADDVRLDGPLVLGDGTRVAAGAAVGPHVVVAERVVIGAGADVAGSLLCAQVSVGDGAIVLDSLVAAGAPVAPSEECVSVTLGPPSVTDPAEVPDGGDHVGT